MFACRIVCACCVLRWIKTLERERLMTARWRDFLPADAEIL